MADTPRYGEEDWYTVLNTPQKVEITHFGEIIALKILSPAGMRFEHDFTSDGFNEFVTELGACAWKGLAKLEEQVTRISGQKYV